MSKIVEKELETDEVNEIIKRASTALDKHVWLLLEAGLICKYEEGEEITSTCEESLKAKLDLLDIVLDKALNDLSDIQVALSRLAEVAA